MRRLAVALALFALASCNTSPTEPSPRDTASCTPPAGATVHTVTIPGSTAPFRVWLSSVTPARGASIRVGDRYELQHKQDGPSGFYSQVRVGLSGGPGAVARDLSASTGNMRACSPTEFSSTFASFPALTGPVFARVQIWMEAGSFDLNAPRPSDRRPPDYEADEPLGWVTQ